MCKFIGKFHERILCTPTMEKIHQTIRVIQVLLEVITCLYLSPSNNLLLRSSCKVVVRRCNLTSLSNYLIFVLCSFFLILRHNQIKVQDHLSQRQQNQSISLNIARYRKAVTGALWVHTALVVSYLSSLITAVVGTRTGYAIIGLPC